ncbi:MAG: hypothetical protein NVS3B25_32370 [Hymenobacter sp.]
MLLPTKHKAGGLLPGKPKNTGEDRQIQAQQQWSRDYAASPMYKQRLLREENADGVSGQAAEQRAAATQGQRQQNLSQGSVTVIPQVGVRPGSVPGMTVGDPRRDKAATDLSADLRARPMVPGNVFLERGYGQTSIPAHELSHQSTHGTAGLNPNTYRNMAATTSPAASPYLREPTEMKARLDAVRYQLKQRGIYDAGTEEFTPAHFQKALADPQISQDPQWQELGRTIGGDASKLNWLMNNVAQNKPSATSAMMARRGGLLPAKLTMLGPDGKPQMELGGGNRIFSRPDTRELVSRSLTAKTPAELKALGGRIKAMLDRQDRNKPEYVTE